MTQRITRTSLILLAVVLAVSPLYAQRGCFHSPEAPASILLLVGGAGMSLGGALVNRMARRKR